MLNKIKSYFENFINQPTESIEEQTHAINLAVAAIMLEMVSMDQQITASEIEQLNITLKNQLDLSTSEISELNRLARQELNNSVDYHQFTSLINSHFEMNKKIDIIEHLWKIAYADGKVDSHEEHFLRKISDLLFVSHSEFIKAKLRVIPH